MATLTSHDSQTIRFPKLRVSIRVNRPSNSAIRIDVEVPCDFASATFDHADYVTTTEALDEAAGRISRYLIAQTIINTSYGFLLTIGLSIIGATMTDGGAFPNAILWGVLATCLRFVPYLGPTAAAVFPSPA